MKEAKYKVGDWVKFKFPQSPPSKHSEDVVVHILERVTNLCEAGTEQHTYVGRMWTIREFGAPVCSKPLVFREMELAGRTEPIEG